MTRKNNKVGSKMTERRKFVRTDEDWSPSFFPYAVSPNPKFCNPLGTTAIAVALRNISDGSKRVYVCGADDFAMFIDLKDEISAERMYERVTDYTSILELKSWGFHYY